MANNALAPNIDNVLSDYVYAGRKLKEQRTNNMLNPQVKSAMTLADLQALKGTPTQNTPTLGERVEGLSYAAGEGFADQLEGFKQLLTTNPKETVMAMYEGLKHVVIDPSILVDMGKQAVASPEAFTRFMAQNLNPMDLANVLNKVGTMRELTVYHGTPHTLPPTKNNPLGEFDASKIGTGEGAASYGHGIYVAENPDFASIYKADRSAVGKYLKGQKTGETNAQQIAQNTIDIYGDKAEKHLEYVLQANSKSKNPAQLASNEEVKSALNLIKENKVKQSGNLYTVDLPDEKINVMLDWNKPLSEQPKIKEIWGKAHNNQVGHFEKDSGYNGKELYRMLEDMSGGDAEQASAYLKKLGIPGIKYLGNDETRNFVVFPGEEHNLKILKRE